MLNEEKSLSELQLRLGQHLKHLRLSKNLAIDAVARHTGLAEKSVRNLESGKGSTTDTLFLVLAALEAGKILKQLAPAEALKDLSEVGGALRPRLRATRKAAKETEHK